MESKHKNALIGALLAVVFVMAVGYAAFAQTLNINGTATISDTSTSWNVHFDDSKDEDSGAVVANKGAGGTVSPNGTITYGDNKHLATLNANLIQPGDSVEFTLTIQNEGSITANVSAPAASVANGDGECQGNVCTFGNIKFTVGSLSQSTLTKGQTATLKVTAEFDSDAQSVGDVTTAGIQIIMNATQAGE